MRWKYDRGSTEYVVSINLARRHVRWIGEDIPGDFEEYPYAASGGGGKMSFDDFLARGPNFSCPAEIIREIRAAIEASAIDPEDHATD
jgi:hypothetical protein